MKKYLFSALLSTLAISSTAQTIVITDLYGNFFCTESAADIGFKATGSFQADNVFEVQLSDPSGNFSASSTIIGKVFASTEGSMSAVIVLPPTIISGSEYNMRVNSTNPAANGVTNDFPITIYSPASAVLSASGGACLGAGSLSLAGIGNAHVINWLENDVTAFSDTSTVYKPSTIAGGNGFGNSSFQLSQAMAVFQTATGDIYISDWDNDRIQKFSAGSNSTSNGTTVAGGNGTGSNTNQLDAPVGIFVDGNGYLYVADAANNRVLKFPPGSTSASNGEIIAGGNGSGSGSDQLDGPVGIYVDGSGNLYVTDMDNNRVQKFAAGSNSATAGTTVAGGNGAGSAADQLNTPIGIFVDNYGNVYVADQSNNRVQKFESGSTSATNGITVAGGNGSGNAANQLNAPSGLFIDGVGSLYVVGQGDNTVKKFPPGSNSNTNGVIVAGGNGAGGGADQLSEPQGIFVDDSGNILIADYGNPRVQKWHPIGAVDSFTPTSAGSYEVTYISGFGCASTGSNVVQVHPATPPTIIHLGNELATDLYSSYQWLLNGAPDGNSQTISLSQDGNYQVIVIDSNGCSDTSLLLDVTSLGIASALNDNAMKLYPNPNTGTFLLETANRIGNEFEIYDLVGNMISHQTITNDKQVIALKGVSAGTYMLQINGSPGLRIRFTVYE